MAADINDKFTEATNGTRPVPTTLTSLKSIGAASISCGALTGWPTATAVHFIIYTTDVNGNKVAGSQTDWKGIVSGTTITNLTLKAGTDNGYAVGAVVQAAPTAAWADDLTEGLMVEHKQDGTHENITADSVTSAGAVSGTTVTGTSVVSTGDIQHRSVSLETIRNNFVFDFVASGGVWSGDAYGSTLAASMTAMVAYVNGRRYSVSAVTARAFTASKDTYIDMDNAGTLVYTEVANNAASPALAANSIRIGIIVSGANIAAVGSVNQGQETKILPIASSIPYQVTDSLGNLICPRDPNRRILGYRQKTTDTSTTNTSATQITGLTVPVIVPTGRKVKITAFAFDLFIGGATNIGANLTIWDGTVGSGTQLQNGLGGYNSSTAAAAATPVVMATPTSASKTYNAGLHATTAGTAQIQGSATTPAILMVELV